MKIINWLKINAPLTRWILWFKATPLIATESRNELKYIISNFYQLAQQNNNQPLVNYLITKYPNEFLQEANPKELPHAVDENSLEKAPSISVPSNHLTFKSSPNTDCELQESKTRVRDNRCCS